MENQMNLATAEHPSHCAPGALVRALVNIGLIGAALYGTGALAATYYVATTGSDNSPGTQAQPWKTIQHAASVAVAGDTVLVAGGVYNQQVSFTRSGTATQKIVFKPADGTTPIIDGTGLAVGQWGTLVGFNNAAYVHFEGFEVRNSSAYLVWIGGESHHLELVGLDVHNGGASGIWLDGPKNRPAMSVISGNHVHDNPQGGITVWSATGGYYLIQGNEVWANKGSGNYDGIQVGGGDAGSHHIVVKNNYVHDNGSADTGEDAIDLGGHAMNHHYLVEANVMAGGTGSFKMHSGDLKLGYYTPGVSGFHIARFNQLFGKGYVAYEYPNPVALYNNTFYNCGQCVMFYGEDSSTNQNLGDSSYSGGDSGRMNWKINIFFQDGSVSAYALLWAGPSGATIDLTYRSVRFQNNLYKFSSGQKIAWPNVFGPGINDSVFNSYKSSFAPNNPDVGSVLTTVTSAQMFVNAAGGDLHLVAGSPAIDKGTPLTKAVAAGSNTTTLVVDRASYFQDGYCYSGECLNAPDSIMIGGSGPVAIVSINDATNTITLATPMTWAAGAPVTLPYKGSAPDMGAFEYASNSALPAPTNLRMVTAP
jgi:hypothetical protein